MNRLSKFAMLTTGSLLTAVVVFVASFFAWEFLWTHLVATDRSQIGLGDGVAVVGGFLIGITLGLATMILILYRYWPSKNLN
jgi:hypothetical protein